MSGSKAGLACPHQFEGAPHHFQATIWQTHVWHQTQHPQHDPATLSWGKHHWAWDWLHGHPLLPAPAGRLGARGVSAPSPVRGRGGWRAGLGSFHGERRRLHPGCAQWLFISMAGWKHAEAPGTLTSTTRFQAQQQPGTFLN